MPHGAEVNPPGCCSAGQLAAERPRKLAGPAELGSRPQERWQRPAVPGSLRGRMKPFLRVWKTAHGQQLALQERTVLPGRSAAAAPSLGGTESRGSTRPSPSSSAPSLEHRGRRNPTRAAKAEAWFAVSCHSRWGRCGGSGERTAGPPAPSGQQCGPHGPELSPSAPQQAHGASSGHGPHGSNIRETWKSYRHIKSKPIFNLEIKKCYKGQKDTRVVLAHRNVK